MSSSESGNLDFLSLPEELILKIVRDDLSAILHFSPRLPIPMNVGDVVNGMQEFDDDDLPTCTSFASPRKRVLSLQAHECTMTATDEAVVPIFLPLTQVCRYLRALLLSDWRSQLGALLFKPQMIDLLMDRLPSNIPLVLERGTGMCLHALRLLRPHMSKAERIDLALPAWYTGHHSKSTCIVVAEAIETAEHLHHLHLRFDPCGPARYPASRVSVLRSVQTVSLLNATVIFVGPNLTDLCIASEGNAGTQLPLDVLLAALRQCPLLQYLDIQGALFYEEQTLLPWQLTPSERPGRAVLRQLRHLLCGGTHMDSLILLYALDVPNTLNFHFDMGLPLGMVPWLNKRWLAWPMLLFDAPHCARDIIDSVFGQLVSLDIWSLAIGTHGPEDGDVPDLVDEEGHVIIPFGDEVAYPIRQSDDKWLDNIICDYVAACPAPEFRTSSGLGLHDVVIGLKVGEKCSTYWTSSRGIKPTSYLPDYVTLAGGSSVEDVRRCLTREVSGRALGVQATCRSLTVRHVPSKVDVDDPVTSAACLEMLCDAYASRCNVRGVKELVVGSMFSTFRPHVPWRVMLSRFSELELIVVDCEVAFGCAYLLAALLSQQLSLCSKLREVHLRLVSSDSDPVWHTRQRLMEEFGKITRRRLSMRWVVDAVGRNGEFL